MRKLPLLFLLLFSLPAYSIKVSEDIYEGFPHYVITTRTATYWFDRQGGGISRMIDMYGNDWIAFKRDPWNKNPESAASSYRGIPNLVYQGDDGGCGHPGWDKCESILEAPDIIRTRSKSGKWEWTWTFYDDKAVMEVLKADPARSYWFLYEGPAGGAFDPENSFWMNNTKGLEKLSDKPDHIKGQRFTGNWQWVAFGSDNLKTMLFLEHHTSDNLTDSFSYMGNSSEGIVSDDGMVVFGFGRTADTKPLLTGIHKFEIRLITQKNDLFSKGSDIGKSLLTELVRHNTLLVSAYEPVTTIEAGSSEVSFIINKPFDSQILPDRDYVKRSESVERTWTWMTAVNPVLIPPYPESQIISGIDIDWTTHLRHAQGSDNFQLTWADDDYQYGIWGDGDGFAGTTGRYRVSMGVARIEGDHDNYMGYDRYGHKESSEAEAIIKGKSWGMICLKGVLYAWIHPDKPGGWGSWEYHHTESRLYSSKDKGASWNPAQWAFTSDDRLAGGNILQFGKNYEGARDKYIYHYMSDPEIVYDSTGNATELMVPGKIYLLRAPLNKIMVRDAYEFFSGLIRGKPSWTTNVEEKQPVFVDNNGVGTPIGISFNPALKRYMLSTEHSKPHSGMIGIFESPEPWGPWSTVTYVTNESWFGHDNPEIIPRNCFFWCFPVKWISADGRSATMVFTGGGRGRNNDSFNSVRVKFIKP